MRAGHVPGLSTAAAELTTSPAITVNADAMVDHGVRDAGAALPGTNLRESLTWLGGWPPSYALTLTIDGRTI
jgi:hypothetical protein